MGTLDFYDAAEKIHQLITSRVSTPVALRKYFDFCNRHFSGSMWKKLSKLDLQTDLANLEAWLAAVLSNEPPKGVTAFLFGIFNPYVNEQATCCLYVAGSTKYRQGIEVPDCFVQPAYFPTSRYVYSHTLAEIYRRSKIGKAAEESEIEYFGCLGFAAIAVAHLMRTVDPKLLLGRASERAVAVGFDEGDILQVGVIRRSGFEPIYTSRPTVREIVPTPSSHAFYELADDKCGRWWLDFPRLPNGEEVLVGFERTGKPLNIALPLMSEIMPTPKGDPVDFTFTLVGVPVVTQRVGRILDALSPGAIQQLPIRIAGKPGRYVVLNLLQVVDCLDRRKSEIHPFPIDEKDLPKDKERPLGSIFNLAINSRRAKGHDIFLLAGARQHIIVSRRVKMLLEAEKVSGIRLKPV